MVVFGSGIDSEWEDYEEHFKRTLIFTFLNQCFRIVNYLTIILFASCHYQAFLVSIDLVFLAKITFTLIFHQFVIF